MEHQCSSSGTAGIRRCSNRKSNCKDSRHDHSTCNGNSNCNSTSNSNNTHPHRLGADGSFEQQEGADQVLGLPARGLPASPCPQMAATLPPAPSAPIGQLARGLPASRCGAMRRTRNLHGLVRPQHFLDLSRHHAQVERMTVRSQTPQRFFGTLCSLAGSFMQPTQPALPDDSSFSFCRTWTTDSRVTHGTQHSCPA